MQTSLWLSLVSAINNGGDKPQPEISLHSQASILKTIVLFIGVNIISCLMTMTQESKQCLINDHFHGGIHGQITYCLRFLGMLSKMICIQQLNLCCCVCFTNPLLIFQRFLR